jgi:hypothetical protein
MEVLISPPQEGDFEGSIIGIGHEARPNEKMVKSLSGRMIKDRLLMNDP